MKNIKQGLMILSLSIIVGATSQAIAQGAHDDAKTIEALKKDYPLTMCVVSGEKLEETSMGKPVDYLYKQTATDQGRLVRFCCKSCISTFNKNPEKYLKAINGAFQKKNIHATNAPHSGCGH